MQKVVLTSFLLGLFISLSGCASTSITSYTDPDYRAVQFKKILVVANTNKLSDRLAMENRFVGAFEDNNITAIGSYTIFPPTREFSDSSKIEIMLRNNIDCCLMLYFGQRVIEQIQIPVIGSLTKSAITKNNNEAKISSNTTFIGGQVVDKPYAEFEIKLFDVYNGRTAWIANSLTGGSAYSDFNIVYKSFCDKIIDRLFEDNLIWTPKEIPRNKKENIERKIQEREWR